MSYDGKKATEIYPETVITDEKKHLIENSLSCNEEKADRWKRIGNKHMAKQEFEKAYMAYSTSLQLSSLGPHSHIFLSNRAASLLSLRKYSEARDDAHRAIAISPMFGKAHARLGQCLYFLKDYDGAVKAYESAVQYDPDYKVTWVYLQKAKQKQKSIQDFKPNNSNEKHEPCDIVKISDNMIETNINNDFTKFHRISNPDSTKEEALDKKKIYSNKIFASQSIELNSETLAKKNQAKVECLNNHKKYAEEDTCQLRQLEISDFNKIDNEEFFQSYEDQQDNNDDPDFVKALTLLEHATDMMSNRQYNTAVEELSAALFLVPDDDNLTPQLYINRANALNGLKRHEGAQKDAMMAISKAPLLSCSHAVLARTLFYKKKYKASVESFEKCQQCLEPGTLLSNLDHLYYRKGIEQINSNIGDNNFQGSSLLDIVGNNSVPKLNPPRSVTRQQLLHSTTNLPPVPKSLSKKLSYTPSSLLFGPERDVILESNFIGTTLHRGPDGIVRILSVTPISEEKNNFVRRGNLYVGDVVREAAGVDLRRPITRIMWGDTVALIKMVPRPFTIVVSKELSEPPSFILEEIVKFPRSRDDNFSSSMLPGNKQGITTMYDDDMIL